MKNRIIGSIAILSLAAFCLSFALARQPQPAAQAAAPQGGGAAPAKRNLTPPGPPHDPHDLDGIWLQVGNFGGGGFTAEATPRIRTGWMSGPLPLTPAGLVKVDSNHGGKGPRAVSPSIANDPMGDANPPGLVRTYVYGRPIEFITLKDSVFQIFEWYHFWHQVWTDGRKVPNGDDVGPLWYGYSVGKWNGDTLDITTVGLDSRAWLDMWGAPMTENMKLGEHWHRLDRDNMSLVLTFDDPTYYTHVWNSDPHMFRLQAKGTPDGEMYEVIFAPIDEQNFNKRIRDPNPLVNDPRKK